MEIKNGIGLLRIILMEYRLDWIKYKLSIRTEGHLSQLKNVLKVFGQKYEVY